MNKKHTSSQIVTKLKQADELLGKGKSISEVCKDLEISNRTYRNWRRKYSGMSPDAVEQIRALQRKHVRLISKIIGVCLVVSILVVLLWGLIGTYLFVRIFDVGFRECTPEAILPDLEKQYKISFPPEIKDIKTARTPGNWDSPSNSDFYIKFSADPNTVDTFLKSFPTKITLVPYERRSDTRKIFGRSTPKWFTKRITTGQEWSWGGAIHIYIDDADKSNFIVYLKGYYYRDPNEIKEELKKN